MQSREFFINGAIWGVVAILISWGLAAGTLSRLDAALIAAVVAWPFAVFYCFRVSRLFGLLMKLYALAPFVALLAIYFKLLDLTKFYQTVHDLVP